MKKLNLRTLYPEYNRDCFITLPADQYEEFCSKLSKDVAGVYYEFERVEDTWQRKRSRYKAHYSLDFGDVIERNAIFPVLMPEQIYEQSVDCNMLYLALDTLPEIQARRIYAHFFLKMSKAEIAKEEKVNKSQITRSIQKGLTALKYYLDNNN